MSGATRAESDPLGDGAGYWDFKRASRAISDPYRSGRDPASTNSSGDGFCDRKSAAAVSTPEPGFPVGILLALGAAPKRIRAGRHLWRAARFARQNCFKLLKRLRQTRSNHTGQAQLKLKVFRENLRPMSFPERPQH